MEKFTGINLKDDKLLQGGHECVRKIKHSDFKIFADVLFRRGEVIEFEFDDKLVEKANFIDVVNISSEDIVKSVSYISGVKKRVKEEDIMLEYRVFTDEEMNQNINNITDEIIKFMCGKGLI